MEPILSDVESRSIPNFLSAFTTTISQTGNNKFYKTYVKDMIGNKRKFYFDEQQDLVFDRYNNMAVITTCKTIEEAIQKITELEGLFPYVLCIRKAPFIVQTVTNEEGKTHPMLNHYIIGCVNYEQLIEDLQTRNKNEIKNENLNVRVRN